MKNKCRGCLGEFQEKPLVWNLKRALEHLDAAEKTAVDRTERDELHYIKLRVRSMLNSATNR